METERLPTCPTHLGVAREGHSFIGSFTDYDNDGDLDIFKINDCPFDGSSQFRLFRNDGGTDAVSDWTFTEDSANMNADWCQNGMGIAVGDYDRDGDLRLLRVRQRIRWYCTC